MTWTCYGIRVTPVLRTPVSRRSCETISLSKFNANTVQIRQPHCWGPIKGPQGSGNGAAAPDSWGPRQTGLTLAVSSSRSISHFVYRFTKREKNARVRGRHRFEHYVGPFTRDISRCPVATFTLLKICFSTRFACAYRLSLDDTADGSWTIGDRPPFVTSLSVLFSLLFSFFFFFFFFLEADPP